MIHTIIILSCFILGSAVFLIVAAFILFFYILRRRDDSYFDEIDLSKTHYAPYTEPLYDAIREMRKEPYTTLHITADDGIDLVGYYYNRGNSRTVIMVHGYHSNPINNFSVLAMELLKKGYNVFFPIHRGHRESGGMYTTMGIKEQYDILKWIDIIDKDESINDVIVYGTSMGGATVGYLSDKVLSKKVKMLAIDCGYTSFYDQMIRILSKNACVGFSIVFPFMWLVCRLLLKVNIAEDNTACIRKTNLPVCFIHGEADRWVGIELTKKNYVACPTDKKLIVVAEAGHTASMLVGGEKTQNDFFEFMEKFITP